MILRLGRKSNIYSSIVSSHEWLNDAGLMMIGVWAATPLSPTVMTSNQSATPRHARPRRVQFTLTYNDLALLGISHRIRASLYVREHCGRRAERRGRLHPLSIISPTWTCLETKQCKIPTPTLDCQPPQRVRDEAACLNHAFGRNTVKRRVDREYSVFMIYCSDWWVFGMIVWQKRFSSEETRSPK